MRCARPSRAPNDGAHDNCSSGAFVIPRASWRHRDRSDAVLARARACGDVPGALPREPRLAALSLRSALQTRSGRSGDG
ncbi:MAG: hypothetical protein BGO98_32025 [Myxococcales bacterium 68-20]|nr:MAG: hypothetical protein BGO98_32025 [Myxococcales bacterium 68-20]